jgi:hypothetical protein
MSEAPGADLLIAHDSGDLESVERLASLLDQYGIRPLLLSERDFAGRSGDPDLALATARAVLFALAMPSPLGVFARLAEGVRSTPDGSPRPVFVALFREANERTAQALDVDAGDVLDLRSGLNENVIGGFASRLRILLDGPPPNFDKRGPVQSEPVDPAPNAPPESPPTPLDVTEVWAALDSAARAAIAQASAVSASRGSTLVHSEDLLIGLYREPDGPTIHILQDQSVSEQAVAAMVAKEIPSISPSARLQSDPALFPPPNPSPHTTEALMSAFSIAKRSDPAAQVTTQHLLAGLVSLTDCSVAEQLRDAGVAVDAVLAWRRPEPEAIPEAIAGFRSDGPGGKDLLNIGPEVDAIATVLAARTVQPPLALGLFGDWGTGKSFFMDRLERRIDQLSKAEAAADRYGDERVYCRHIVQLKFNAWHYIDENLWASLANAIFEGLDEALANRRLPADLVKEQTAQRANLLLEQAQAQAQLEELRKSQAEADRKAADAQSKVAAIDGLYDELVEAVQPGAIIASAVAVATSQPELADPIASQRAKVEQQVDAAARDLGISPQILREELAGRQDNGVVAAVRAVFRGKGRRIWLPIAGLALIAFAVIAALLAAGLDVAALVAVLATFILGVAGPLRPFIEAAQKIWSIFAAARTEGERLVEEKREAFRKVALEEKAKAEKEAADAARKVEAQETKVKTTIDGLAKLRPGREMADFVRARQASNVYRSRLGIVAKARDDFEELTRLLIRDWPDPDPDLETVDGPKPIERIILYIDDLDRVKEKEVVAVLQAVHLLLAFRLFVVVVAVDPRWLLHSLRVESNVFNADQQGLSDDEEDGFGWESTPLNYLEKIFQIPFALRPMGSEGFAAIVDNLVDHKDDAAGRDGGNGHDPTAALTDAALPSGGSSGNGTTPGTQPPLEAPTDQAREGESGASPPPTTGSPTPSHVNQDDAEAEDDIRPVVMKPRSLEISDDERTFMARMHPLIGTPRGAKRFVNVYRLLKASHPVEEQGQFARPEAHRPVLLLLACLTGFPRETAEILRVLVEDRPQGSWWEFVIPFADVAAKDGKDQLRKDAWEQFAAKLRLVQSAETDALTCDDVRLRARRVARYSFESSRVLFMEAEEAKLAKPTRTASMKKPASKRAATSKAAAAAGRDG